MHAMNFDKYLSNHLYVFTTITIELARGQDERKFESQGLVKKINDFFGPFWKWLLASFGRLLFYIDFFHRYGKHNKMKSPEI